MPVPVKEFLKNIHHRKKKSPQDPSKMPSAMPTATASDVVKAVDEFRPALEETARTCNNNSVAQALAGETFNLLLRPVTDLPAKLCRERISAESSRSVTSVDYEALVTTVQGCKKKTEEFVRGLENKNETVMLVSLKEIVNGVLFFVKDASLAFNQDLIKILNQKAQDLERSITEGAQRSNSAFHNYSTGQQIAASGNGDQNINTGTGVFFGNGFTSNGAFSLSGAVTQNQHHSSKRPSQRNTKRSDRTESPDSSADEDN